MTAIAESGIAPHKLKLELTESLLADGIDVTVAKMGSLKEMGVTLSLDDFGMGYSSLSYLKRLPLDELKIDREFVKDILTDPNDAAIARTIIGLAQSLGLRVIAEGVETQAQRAFLAHLGCYEYQGYLFCKPLPIDELEAFMDALGVGLSLNRRDLQRRRGHRPRHAHHDLVVAANQLDRLGQRQRLHIRPLQLAITGLVRQALELVLARADAHRDLRETAKRSRP